MLRKNLLVLIVCIGCFTTYAHDSNLATVKITKVNTTWKMSVSYGSHGLLHSMRDYYKDQSLVLEDTPGFKDKLKKYITQHFSLKLNKLTEISLKNFSFHIHHHATEVYVELGDMPAITEYWEFTAPLCGTNHAATVMIEVLEGTIKSNFVLKHNSWNLNLIRDNKQLKRVI